LSPVLRSLGRQRPVPRRCSAEKRAKGNAGWEKLIGGPALQRPEMERKTMATTTASAKKVVMICGSPRPKGNTMQLLEECGKVLKAAGVDFEIISLAGKKINACLACYKCAEAKKCVQNDELNDIISKVRDAKGFIVGSPVYFGTARGDVMNMLQRIGMVNRATDKFLTGKVGGPIAVARRGGLTLTLSEMMMFFQISDMIVPGSSYWNMVIGRNPGDAMKDQEGVDTVRHFAENVANLVKKLD